MNAKNPPRLIYIPNDYSLYQPLDKARKTIRLLRVKTEPAGSDAIVLVHLTYASLSDPRVPGNYSCLSYCWGSLHETTEIDVVQPQICRHDGTYDGRVTRLKVTKTLEAALRKLRSLTERPLVWADAVCINQSDPAERGDQVAIMQDIYGQASQTLVWLGDTERQSLDAMEFALHIRRSLLIDPPKDLVVRPFLAGVKTDRLKGLLKGQLRFNHEELSHQDFIHMRGAVQDLLSRPWFRRAWVLQEVHRAAQVIVMLGDRVCQWQDIIHLGVWENRVKLNQGEAPWSDRRRLKGTETVRGDKLEDPERDNDLPEIWHMLNVQFSNSKLVPISELIFRRAQIKASDLRDQVFALFGLIVECRDDQSRPLGFYPDYTKTIAETYANFTRAVIASTSSLTALSAVNTFHDSENSENHVEDRPSWTPDYNNHFNLRRSIAYMGINGLKAAGYSRPPSVENPRDNRLLCLYGILIDKLVVSEPRHAFENPMRVMRCGDSHVWELLIFSDTESRYNEGGIVQLWRSLCTKEREKLVFDINDDLVEAFILTLICSQKDRRQRASARSVTEIPNLINDFAAYWGIFEPDFLGLPEQSTLYTSRAQLASLSITGNAAEFGDRILWTCDSRHFMVTQNGHVGLFPKTIQSGDQIVVFYGANVPYVVRPVHHTEQHDKTSVSEWELIGECYVHGRMHGSVMEELKQGLLQPEWLQLR